MSVNLMHTFRALAKSPGFTAVIVLILALGIGASTAIFTLVNSLVLRALPFAEAHELVLMNERSSGMQGMSVSWPNFVDWRSRNRGFEAMAAFRSTNYNLTGVDQPVRVSAQETTHELFPILEIPFALGRGFRAAEDQPGAAPTVVLSYRLWTSAFGQDPAILGDSVTLHGRSYQVVGVTAPAFDPRAWVASTDLWTPLGLGADRMSNRGDHPGITVLGRIKDGSSFEQATADMDRIARELQQEHPQSNAGNFVRIRPLREVIVGQMETPMKLLLAAVGFVLLIACANVANLLLARATRRRSDAAVRAALGASRGRLIRQSLGESFALAGAGALVGAAIAMACISLVMSHLPVRIPEGTDVRLDWAALAFMTGVSALAALIFGVAPALQTSSVNLTQAISEGGRGGAGASRHPLRAALVVGEIALAAVLLVGSALMMRSFWNVLDADPGFDPDHVLTMRFSLPDESYSQPMESARFAERLLERIQELPGVVHAGITHPLLGGSQMSAHPEGFPEPAPDEHTPVDYAVVTPDQLRAMGVKLIRGRFFTDFDEKGVLIVDETFAEKYWPSEEAIGKRVKVGGFRSNEDYSEIVGVVSHVKNYGVDQDSRIEMYIPFKARPSRSFSLVVRANVDPGSLADPIRATVREIDEQLPVFGVQTMRELLGERVALRRLAAWLMSLFGAAALLLAALGIYGVMSYAVSERRREVGLRMALGAQRSGVLSLIVGQGARLIAIGLAIGLCAAIGLSRLVETLLFEVAATDASSYSAVGVVLAVTGALASLIPALRASRVDPMEALRHD